MGNQIEITIVKQLIGQDEVNGVNARDLWKALDVQTQFADWIKRRLLEINAIEGEDFLSFVIKNGQGRGSKDYIITVDMAKHIAMLEKNERGYQVRKYFIECEKKLRESSPKTYLEALKALVKEVEAKEALQQQNAVYAERLSMYKDTEQVRRKKSTLRANINRQIRLLARQKFDDDYKAAYNHVYKIFADAHCFTHGINMDFIMTSVDYLVEVLEIVLAEFE